jgi:membrane-bound serine protease (ClpP class)
MVLGIAGKSGRRDLSWRESMTMHGGPETTWRRRLARWWRVLGVATLAWLLTGVTASGQDAGSHVLATRVSGAITPVIAAHIEDGIAEAERDRAVAYLVELDTPGGLDTSMRDIVQDILASDVPVIVYISPQGARGASAGAVITFAAHVAAMAPGTAIGAATPVGGQGGEDLEAKVVNDAIAYVQALAELRDRNADFAADTVRDGRSASASEALEIGAVDVVAASVDELLDAIDGMTVQVGSPPRDVRLHTAGASIETQDLGILRTIQQFLADPNIAFLLLSVGTLGLIYELATPGLGVGGALGLTFIVLAMFGLAVLPVDVVGVLFLLLAAVLFVAEVAAPGIGLAAAGGALSLVLSGLFLIEDAPGLEISAAVVVPAAVVVGLFVVIAGRVAVRSRATPSTTTGRGQLVGQRARVRRTHAEPQAFVQGAWWRVQPTDPDVELEDGAGVDVVDVDGLTLLVEPHPRPVTIADQPPDRGGTS